MFFWRPQAIKNEFLLKVKHYLNHNNLHQYICIVLNNTVYLSTQIYYYD